MSKGKCDILVGFLVLQCQKAETNATYKCYVHYVQRCDHTTDFTHTLHSLLYHSVTTLADNEIEQQLRCPLWSSKFGACISVSCIKLSQISA